MHRDPDQIDNGDRPKRAGFDPPKLRLDPTVDEWRRPFHEEYRELWQKVRFIVLALLALPAFGSAMATWGVGWGPTLAFVLVGTCLLAFWSFEWLDEGTLWGFARSFPWARPNLHALLDGESCDYRHRLFKKWDLRLSGEVAASLAATTALTGVVSVLPLAEIGWRAALKISRSFAWRVIGGTRRCG